MTDRSPFNTPGQTTFAELLECGPSAPTRSDTKAWDGLSPIGEYVPVCTVKLVWDDTLVARGPTKVRSPRDIAALLSAYLKGADREHFVLVQV
jgi:hypothetical protein